MKNLGQFFDYQRFFEGKKLVVTDNQPYVDFNTKETLKYSPKISQTRVNPCHKAFSPFVSIRRYYLQTTSFRLPHNIQET